MVTDVMERIDKYDGVVRFHADPALPPFDSDCLPGRGFRFPCLCNQDYHRHHSGAMRSAPAARFIMEALGVACQAALDKGQPTADERFLLEADLKLMKGELKRLSPESHPNLDYPMCALSQVFVAAR